MAKNLSTTAHLASLHNACYQTLCLFPVGIQELSGPLGLRFPTKTSVQVGRTAAYLSGGTDGQLESLTRSRFPAYRATIRAGRSDLSGSPGAPRPFAAAHLGGTAFAQRAFRAMTQKTSDQQAESLSPSLRSRVEQRARHVWYGVPRPGREKSDWWTACGGVWDALANVIAVAKSKDGTWAQIDQEVTAAEACWPTEWHNPTDAGGAEMWAHLRQQLRELRSYVDARGIEDQSHFGPAAGAPGPRPSRLPLPTPVVPPVVFDVPDAAPALDTPDERRRRLLNAGLGYLLHAVEQFDQAAAITGACCDWHSDHGFELHEDVRGLALNVRLMYRRALNVRLREIADRQELRAKTTVVEAGWRWLGRIGRRGYGVALYDAAGLLVASGCATMPAEAALLPESIAMRWWWDQAEAAGVQTVHRPLKVASGKAVVR